MTGVVTRRPWAVVLVACALIAAPAASVRPSQAATAEPAGYLRGTVTDTRGEPVEGALVSETRHFEDSVSWSEPTVTAADGSFEIGPLDPGTYTLRFSDTRQNRYATEWWDDATTRTAAKRIEIVGSESSDHLDAELDDLQAISGRVTGAHGSPASGATVRIFKRDPSDNYAEVGTGSPLTTGGRYEIAVQPGTYRLAFDAAPGMYRSEYWDDVRRPGLARDVVVTDTTSVQDIDAQLSVAPPVRVTGSPTLSGRVRVGEWLRVDSGTWDVARLRFTYQWRADGTVLPRATGRRLLLTPRLRGRQIGVRVTATATAAERSPGLAMTGRTGPVAPA
ncbi:carboxypeptidase regulatory-like domain-containing protein [Nocardioides sp.]|uniref:carboxypeptidase regulatory-like domain-containing protein n=1 Tax=Nocardioides sp. TaxID=35761 RepID=UPI002D80E980|nr:carboxypeptidase regulatory-like domain-containing protein [Nocardioides sp.]HET8959787.1 carboxypeptidase regulatory-like domain-containing protein [Nocardioides sp.]